MSTAGGQHFLTQENDGTLISGLKFKLRTGPQGRVAGASLKEGQASRARRKRMQELSPGAQEGSGPLNRRPLGNSAWVVWRREATSDLGSG